MLAPLFIYSANSTSSFMRATANQKFLKEVCYYGREQEF